MRHGFYILDSDNRVVPVETAVEWATWREANDVHVGYTQITSEVEVSTVFLGIDHNFSGHGPPILFETMIFGGEEDQYQKRYSSWDDAKTGHNALVKRLRARYLVKS